jgi:hypothetical protein
MQFRIEDMSVALESNILTAKIGQLIWIALAFLLFLLALINTIYVRMDRKIRIKEEEKGEKNKLRFIKAFSGR